jgi:hypothetical protein
MYKLKYYESTGQITVKYFNTVNEALRYSVYKAPFHSFYSIDKVEE